MGRRFPGHDVRVVDEDLTKRRSARSAQIAVRVKPEKPPSMFLRILEESGRERAWSFAATTT